MIPFGSLDAAPLELAALLALGTLVSEDLSCITAGLLVSRGNLGPLMASVSCFIGIYAGDLGLFVLGRLAGSHLSRRDPKGEGRLDAMGRWFERNAAAAILLSRFLPGSRLPLYLAAGAVGKGWRRFAFWSLVACLIWTPLFVFAVARWGERFVAVWRTITGDGWPALAAGAATLYLVVHAVRLAATREGRQRAASFVSGLRIMTLKARRYEFWPAWLFYLPVVPWIAWLSIRHRGFATVTAANPGIADGGFVGESKHAILSRLDPGATIPTLLLPEDADPARRTDQLGRALSEKGWSWPIVLKPDVGQRGASVRIVRNESEAAAYLASARAAVLVQPWHPGPFEAGVFYYRIPGEERGRILSITEKVFPVIEGDGSASLDALIRRHPRYRMQARVFLARHRAERGRVLARGERFRLAMAGNHVQGTMFLDGAHLITPELERAVDRIARTLPGFYFGRFDVRFSDPGAFRAGRGLSVVELNGITSESTNIYDPSWTLGRAHRVLRRQWRLLFEIGARNRRRGHPVTPIRRLIASAADFYFRRAPHPLSD